MEGGEGQVQVGGQAQEEAQGEEEERPAEVCRNQRPIRARRLDQAHGESCSEADLARRTRRSRQSTDGTNTTCVATPRSALG